MDLFIIIYYFVCNCFLVTNNNYNQHTLHFWRGFCTTSAFIGTQKSRDWYLSNVIILLRETFKLTMICILFWFLCIIISSRLKQKSINSVIMKNVGQRTVQRIVKLSRACHLSTMLSWLRYTGCCLSVKRIMMRFTESLPFSLQETVGTYNWITWKWVEW